MRRVIGILGLLGLALELGLEGGGVCWCRLRWLSLAGGMAILRRLLMAVGVAVSGGLGLRAELPGMCV